jgi:hypothetical protein
MLIENAKLCQIKPRLEIKGNLEIDRYKLVIKSDDTTIEYNHQLLQEVERKECLYIYYRHFVCIKLIIAEQDIVFQELQKHIDTSTKNLL